MTADTDAPSPLSSPLSRIDGLTGARRHFRYFDYVMAAFVAILLLSNLIGASKLANIGGVTFGAGILFFPVSYVIGDVLTEVYGYANARRCVWAGFFAMIFMAFMSFVVVAMPPDSGWTGQAAYEAVFGSTWRIVLASLTAFWAGEFVNSFVLAKMKLMTGGKHLWMRTIGSTVVGQAADSALFYPIAFLGTWTHEQVLTVMVTNWGMKVLWEAVLTPVTYVVVGWLKKREGVEVFDDNLDFSPFAKAKSV
ncbi:queuosine precursor transporter [Novosphingobium resinovorum]|uniref:queuosine precursor transporter n=1 Tax=Novosphingobium TaxID=165696 RepID=UPI001B3C6B83|nr:MULTISPECIES: queuosine precursor transporter [Novosphingobium]MBF7010521.1 queuosine precursor transporter [Novosphingobium sp. HR1a]WJM28521.1 queuosine precursor transporter [Novosphingobium resinovorum]